MWVTMLIQFEVKFVVYIYMVIVGTCKVNIYSTGQFGLMLRVFIYFQGNVGCLYVYGNSCYMQNKYI